MKYGSSMCIRKMPGNACGIRFSVDTISDYEPGTLESHGIFKTDILVVATGNEDVNAEIAYWRKRKGLSVSSQASARLSMKQN